MNEALNRNLAAWESGEVSQSELLARHGEHAASLTALHTRLMSLAELPAAPGSWAAVAKRLEARRPRMWVRFSQWMRRPLALGMVGATITGSIAFASPEVRHQFGSLLGQSVPVHSAQSQPRTAAPVNQDHGGRTETSRPGPEKRVGVGPRARQMETKPGKTGTRSYGNENSGPREASTAVATAGTKRESGASNSTSQNPGTGNDTSAGTTTTASGKNDGNSSDSGSNDGSQGGTTGSKDSGDGGKDTKGTKDQGSGQTSDGQTSGSHGKDSGNNDSNNQDSGSNDSNNQDSGSNDSNNQDSSGDGSSSTGDSSTRSPTSDESSGSQSSRG